MHDVPVSELFQFSPLLATLYPNWIQAKFAPERLQLQSRKLDTELLPPLKGHLHMVLFSRKYRNRPSNGPTIPPQMPGHALTAGHTHKRPSIIVDLNNLFITHSRIIFGDYILTLTAGLASLHQEIERAIIGNLIHHQTEAGHSSLIYV